jgi:hypothetical protein
MGRGIVAAQAAVFSAPLCRKRLGGALCGDDSLARRYTHPTSSAHSSSGLGHRPLTAAARVRIPYGPFYGSQSRGFRMVTRVRRVRDAAKAHVVPTPAPPQIVVTLGARTVQSRRPSARRSSRVGSSATFRATIATLTGECSNKSPATSCARRSRAPTSRPASQRSHRTPYATAAFLCCA